MLNKEDISILNNIYDYESKWGKEHDDLKNLESIQ